MCDACWNAEVFADKVKNRALCDGEEMMSMSFETLKYNLTQEWLQTDKSNYFIFRKAIEDAPQDTELDLTVAKTLPNGHSKKGSLHITFI